MHPAPSIIVFTTLSGLGFGLLAFLGLGFPAATGFTAFVFFTIAYALAIVGLVSSMLHLGHPERFLKAFTQWRSSWLSREGVLSVATLVVMALYGAGLVFFDARVVPLGWLGAALAIATVYGTSMIYAQLKTVPRWNHWTTPALFLGYALAGGALLSGQTSIAVPLLIALGAAQLVVWQMGDRRFAQSGSTMQSATQLGTIGKVRAFEPPHTGTNYLMTEMIHVLARRHVLPLRIIAIALMAVLPWLFLSVFSFNHLLAGVAMLSHLAGVLVSRWLFFAEAEHVVGLYYGKR